LRRGIVNPPQKGGLTIRPTKNHTLSGRGGREPPGEGESHNDQIPMTNDKGS
jgi:hypothetical protein